MVEVRGGVADDLAEYARRKVTTAGAPSGLGLDFHLFVEKMTGQDAVVYRDGPTGLRLNRLEGGPDRGGSHSVVVTVSPQRAPLLDTAEAVERLRVTDLPFLFYLDADHERANVQRCRQLGVSCTDAGRRWFFVR